MKRHLGVPGEPGFRILALGSAILLAVVLAGGWFFVSLFVSYGESLERKALLQTASTAAASFEPARVSALAGNPVDPAGAALNHVRGALQRTRDAVANSRFAYLLGEKGGDIIFLADAEPAGSADYSPPGEVYGEASPGLRAIFATKQPIVEGPLRDRWGDWVSGLAPIVDPATGQVIAVFGIDIRADSWEAGVARYRGLGIVIAGLVAAIAIFSAIFAFIRYRFGLRLAVANRIVANGTAILYRIAAGPVPTLTFVSGNIAKLGYEPAELVDKESYLELVHPDDRARVSESLRRVLGGGVEIETIEFRITDRQQSHRWFDNRAAPIRDSSGKVVAIEGILVDITERKLTEDKLREDEATIQSLVDQGIFGVYVVGEDGRIAFVNAMFARMAGYGSSADYEGRPLIDFIADADRATVRNAIAALLSGEAATVEVAAAILRKQGGTIDVLAQATLTRFRGKRAIIGAATDITARKRAEEQLRNSEAALAEAQSIAHVGSFDFNVRTRSLTWSREHYRIYGVDPASFTPTYEALVARIHPDDRAAFETGYADSVAKRQPFEFDKRIVLDDGSIRFVHDSARTSYDASGRPIRSIGTVQDISDRRNAEQRMLFANTLLSTELETSPDGILVVDAANRIISFNRRFADMWNVSLDLIAKGDDAPVLDAVTSAAKDPEKFLARVRYLYEHTDETGHDEVETRDGRFIDRHSAPLRGPAGQYLGRVWFFRDVTERKHAEEAIRASEERLQIVFRSVNDGIFVTDLKTGKLIDVNPAGCEIFEYDRNELIGDDIIAHSSGIPPYTEDEAAKLVGKARTEGPQRFEWQCRARNGRLFWAEFAIRCTVFGKQEVMLATLRDVTQRKAAEAQILRSARYDSLTGLANRAVFIEAVDQAMARARRGEKSFAVLYLDLDHFKDVNDTLGHPAGDELLRMVASRLRSTIREVDTVARFGGDEFAVIAADIAEPADAGILAEVLLKALGAPFRIEGDDIRSGASIGISMFEPDQPDGETLLSQADVALYRAKSEGRGTYRFFTDAMDAEVRTRVSLSTELREAIASGELFLLYQPQVRIESGQITGVEALVRWRHPRRGVLPPSLFIPVAETSGLTAALGHWVMLEACRQAKAWLDQGIAPGRIAVNLSGMQFKRPAELEGHVADILAETGLPPHRLELELTETILMETSQEHNQVLLRLRENGVGLAIDDFGTGYSSLDYLRRFPVDRIKIAQDFVGGIATVPGSAAIVKATIELARGLGIAVIAEGVESADQLAILKGLGCREVQGFYFAEPLSPAELEPLLRTGRIRGHPKPRSTRTAA